MSTKKQFYIPMIIHCVFFAMFTVAWIVMVRMCTYGGVWFRIPIVALCFILTIYYISWAIAWKAGRKRLFPNRIILIIYAVLLFLIGGVSAGLSIHSLVDVKGVFRTTLGRMGINQRIILEETNLYTEKFSGLLHGIREKVDLSEKLYVKGQLELDYNADGTLTLLKGTVYGKDENENTVVYDISYDVSISNEMSINRKMDSNVSFSDNEKLDPFIRTFNAMLLHMDESVYEASRLHISYGGRKYVPANAENLYLINDQGVSEEADIDQIPEYGDLVTCYIYKEGMLRERREYLLADDSSSSSSGNDINQDSIEPRVTTEQDGYSVAEECTVDEKIGYRLVTVDAALGTYYYSLYKTTDGGKTYKEINKNPFQGKGGVSHGITFIDNQLGFLCLTNASGENGTLYRTEDGGVTFKEIMIQSDEADASCDLPEMPEQEKEYLQIRVSQGADGDYKGGVTALFISKDRGITWTYIGEIKQENNEIG
ncbi:MAG: hypothetical protein Q4G58_01505 [bacterium]|nr:hypothetical protein [bacterium]